MNDLKKPLPKVNVQPIRPEDVSLLKQETIPDCVMNAFNEMIVARWKFDKATFTQDQILAKILIKAEADGIKLTKDMIFDNGWLDVEEIYENIGWKVNYDKADYTTTDPSTFTFRRQGSSSPRPQ